MQARELISAPDHRRAWGIAFGSFTPVLATLMILAVLLSLGHWQQRRLAWKENLLARIAGRQIEPPIKIASAADVAALKQATDDYRRAHLIGSNWQQAVYWFTQIHNKPPGLAHEETVGYHMLLPFELADQSMVLLDAGFVPARLKGQYDLPIFTDPRVILHWPDKRSLFDAPDDPFENLFAVRDTTAIGRHWQVDLPIFIAERVDVGAGWPRGGQTRLRLRNRHFGYMLTWYGLAASLVFVSGLWHIRKWMTHRAKRPRQ